MCMCLVVFHLFFFELTPFATTEIQFLSADLPYSLHSWTTLVQISLEDELKFYYLWDIILEYLQVLLVVFYFVSFAQERGDKIYSINTKSSPRWEIN